MSTDRSGFHDFPVSRKWRAKWIWAPGDAAIANSFYLFRKELLLTARRQGAVFTCPPVR